MIHPGGRYFTSTIGSMTVKKGSMIWKPAQVQVCFCLTGAKADAVVTAITTKRGLARIDTDYIGVDVLDGDAPHHLVIHGDEAKVTLQETLKQFLAFQQRR